MPASPKGRRTEGAPLRIIGGCWRGSKISFADSGIRPTLNQIRETLFNWLGARILDAHCLDLFAGSGIHAMEAMSRGATSAVAVDISAAATRQIRAEFNRLQGPTTRVALEVITDDAHDFLAGCREQFDVIFLDPPFDTSRTLLSVASDLTEKRLLAPGGLIYFETDAALAQVPPGLQLLRQKRTGQVSYGLLSED